MRCRHCGSTSLASLTGEGRVAGRFERRIVCLKCRKAAKNE